MAQLLRGSLWIGRFLGVRVGIHPSWLPIFALVVWAIAGSFSDLDAANALLLATVTALAFFASVVIHEFAHALVARRYGVGTLAIRLFLFGGVATIASEPPTPGAEAAIAVAGPLCSLVLAALCGAGVEALRAFGGEPHAALVLISLAAANAFLALFNLLPAFPMDGGRLLRALLWHLGGDRRAATRLASVVGLSLAAVLGLAGVGLAWRTHQWESLWYVALAGFVSVAAMHSYQESRRGGVVAECPPAGGSEGAR